jgi:hypothetical protein
MSEHKQIGRQRYHHRYHKCPEYGCKNLTEIKCKYCQQYYCKDHASPKLVGSINYIENIIKTSEPEKYKKYIEDHMRRDGHPCGAYTAFWNKEFDSKHEDSANKFIAALDKLKQTKTYNYGYPGTNGYTKEKALLRFNLPRYHDGYSNYNNRHHHRPYRRDFHRINFRRSLSFTSMIFVILLVLLVITYTINSFSYFWLIADVFAVFLAVIIAYRLFVWANKLPIHSDLHLFGLRILSGFVALFGFFVIFFYTWINNYLFIPEPRVSFSSAGIYFTSFRDTYNCFFHYIWN